MAEGLQREAELLGPLAASRTSKNLVSIFLMQRAARRDPGVDDPAVRPKTSGPPPSSGPASWEGESRRRWRAAVSGSA